MQPNICKLRMLIRPQIKIRSKKKYKFAKYSRGYILIQFNKRNDIIYKMQATQPQIHNKNRSGVSAQVVTQRINNMLQKCKIKSQSIQQLPESFYQFMKTRGLDVKQLAIPIPRYVRVKPNTNISTQEIAQDIGISMEEIVKIDDYFWALNPEAKINRSKLYENSILYGMDYSSAIPVHCLDLQEGMHVLELCSAPGNKSMLMADSFKQISIKGVEISHNRANIMRSLIKKYKLDAKIEVIETDGLKYHSENKFDRVLVDAECTHQGSLKHIFKFFHEAVGTPQNKKGQKLSKQQQKQFKKNNTNPYTSQVSKANEWSSQDFQQRFLDSFKLSNLHQLQSGLLQNGFSQLKDGGILVYSTCSFDQHQNQKIIVNFLNNHIEDAELIDATKGLNCAVGWKEGTLKGSLRFSPSFSCCGGMFIAKLRKKMMIIDLLQ